MVSLSWLKVQSISSDHADCVAEVDGGIGVRVWLPTLYRPEQSALKVGSRLLCIWDSVSGEGGVVYSPDDFAFRFGQSVSMADALTVHGDVKSEAGDVKAGTISLKTHRHVGATISAADAGAIVTAASSGSPAECKTLVTGMPT